MNLVGWISLYVEIGKRLRREREKQWIKNGNGKLYRMECLEGTRVGILLSEFSFICIGFVHSATPFLHYLQSLCSCVSVSIVLSLFLCVFIYLNCLSR
ncbi:hypothetical protein MtrunA17_Chr1g0199881 [Medicago truncatula]|uniref:Transmembrane protein n=1 Tax=Medicago truncatula TaxID=3880 RepID=A0A396JT64_MEDTR|nr:hypothetical protein MtrunA17_Chr1g0199881 [Medicago truncatula]